MFLLSASFFHGIKWWNRLMVPCNYLKKWYTGISYQLDLPAVNPCTWFHQSSGIKVFFSICSHDSKARSQEVSVIEQSLPRRSVKEILSTSFKPPMRKEDFSRCHGFWTALAWAYLSLFEVTQIVTWKRRIMMAYNGVWLHIMMDSVNEVHHCDKEGHRLCKIEGHRSIKGWNK